ncbi:MAG: hypothetical protein L6R36_001870 [Xanthoria steineri]|nr:MAG: hypothetical protein L6R36_001870 [Xanthoria steineri]
MSAAKSRKPFAYADREEVDEELPEYLDEEEQEKLIAQLKVQNEARNTKFKWIFLTLPLISAIAFLPSLLSASSIRARLISLLSISSMLCTAYNLFSLPNAKPTRKLMYTHEPPGPLLQYGPYLNGGSSLLIGLSAFMIDDRKMGHDGFRLLCLLPIVVFTITTSAGYTMRSVDIESLEKLKYPYKGA